MEIDVIATVVSPDDVRAPLAGEKAAVVHIEGHRDGAVVGTAILGDLLRLRLEDGSELELVARRAAMMFTTRFDPPASWPTPVPAELVPLLRLGATGLRERLVRSGDRLRVRGSVEAYRSSAGSVARFVVLGEAAPLRLDEVLRFA